jgi:hypothetical protein
LSKLLLSFGNDKIVALSIQGTRDLVEVRRSLQTGVYTDNSGVVEEEVREEQTHLGFVLHIPV